MPGANECAIALKGAQMISVGSHADVSVGAHREERGTLDAEKTTCAGFEVSDLVGQVVARAEGDGRFEQGGVGGNLLQGGEEIRKVGTLDGCAAEKYESMPGTMGELVKSTGLRARRLDRDSVG